MALDRVPGDGRAPRLETATARPPPPDQDRRAGAGQSGETGAVRGRRHAERRRLQRAARAGRAGRLPVVTTLMPLSAFPESHELHFGWPGMHGPKWSNWAINKCDLLVAVGARFDDRVTGKLGLRAGSDRRSPRHRFCKRSSFRQADILVVGPLKQVLADLADEPRALSGTGALARTEPWLRQLAAWRGKPRCATAERETCSSLSRCSRHSSSSPPEGRRLDDGGRPTPDVKDAVLAM